LFFYGFSTLFLHFALKTVKSGQCVHARKYQRLCLKSLYLCGFAGFYFLLKLLS
jgi:NADH:ubiquinone oxidoreductase subunit 6 (subunit J)